MFFLPDDGIAADNARRIFDSLAEAEGLYVLCWRDVPCRPELLGAAARRAMPRIRQCFLARPADAAPGEAFDRRLYILRRQFEKQQTGAYVCSLSCRTIVYKGMMLVTQLRAFYDDLQSADYASPLAMVHSRFSTNTFPSWSKAHPQRLLLHNGEINTIRGNFDRMRAREETMRSPLLGEDMLRVLPVIQPGGSDSQMLDNTLEFLYMNGMPLPLAGMVLLPEPWQGQTETTPWRDLYRYYSTMMEPWDGPAAILYSDGDVVCASLDRNGLRPLRCALTDEGRLILSSEAGALYEESAHITRRWRLNSGGILVADVRTGELLENGAVKARFAAQRPYGEWTQGILRLQDIPGPVAPAAPLGEEERARLCAAFGYAHEDIEDTILPMAVGGVEPTASMGADEPLAALSHAHPPLFAYFKQRFAQVTNPPIDAIREKVKTDESIYIGDDGNLLSPAAENCRVIELDGPVLTAGELERIRGLRHPDFRVRTIPLLYPRAGNLQSALEGMFAACDRACREGANIVILSDRGLDGEHLAIPSLLAVSALEQHLVREKKRTAVSVLLESGEPRDVHQLAMLIGFGARAVNPYLAHECVLALCASGRIDKSPAQAIAGYDRALSSGVLKVASKMGVSTLQAYQSAQLFEAVGLDAALVNAYFTNTPHCLGGTGLPRIEEDSRYHHDRAFLGPIGGGALPSVGRHRLRTGHGAEEHLYSPEVIHTLQQALWNDDRALFDRYAAMVEEDGPRTIRSLLTFRYECCKAVPLEEVEPVESIVRRFKTGAMSYGSISREAHECLALAMNHLGGKSNSGEGGELPERFGTMRNSAIKQVASGRFGVTRDYLLSAKEIQIKMAQGAKPGEGGHLPGAKVTEDVARTRCSTPGVSLISPPPHHDIYSIEDLAELIYDLQCANEDARVTVKLVSSGGVGTIASGVAKAGAKGILISGGEGGTGAAPMSSIHHAGLPWEIGLAEAPSGAVPQRPAPVRDAGDGRQADERPRCRRRPAAGRGGIWLRHRAACGPWLPHDARLPSGHLSLRHRHAGSKAAQALRRQAGIRGTLHALCRQATARDHGAAGRAHRGTARGPRRPAQGKGGRAHRPFRAARFLPQHLLSPGLRLRSAFGRPRRQARQARPHHRRPRLWHDAAGRGGYRGLRLRRAGLRRLCAAGAEDHLAWRGQRLPWQGPFRRHAGGVPARGRAVERRRRAHRQRRPLWRDQRRSLHRRRGGRALLRAQFRRGSRGRGRGRPRLRVHDRRPRRHPRPRGRQLRRGHVRRHRLRAGQRGRPRAPHPRRSAGGRPRDRRAGGRN